MAQLTAREKSCFKCYTGGAFTPATTIQTVLRKGSLWVEKVCDPHQGPKAGGGGKVVHSHPWSAPADVRVT